MTKRQTYKGPIDRELDRQQWESLYETMPDDCKEWVNSIAGRLSRHTEYGNQSLIPEVGPYGARELAVKLLIFIVNRENNNAAI